MNRSITRSLAQAAMIASVVFAGACKNKDQSQAAAGDVAADSIGAASVPTDSTPEATSSTDVDVDNVSLGRSLKADNSIDDGTTDFKPTDKIIAVVETDHAPAGAEIVAHWTYGDNNELVAEQTEKVASVDNARTVFQLKKSSAWPAGKYHLRLTNGAKELATKDFEVKK